MSYSQEEIERKRQLALQRKNQALNKSVLSPAANNKNNRSAYTPNNRPFNQERSTHFSPQTSYAQRNGSHVRKGNKSNGRFTPIKTQSFFGQNTKLTIKCHMIANDKFALETSSYFGPLIETVKTVPSRTYDMETKTWSFLLKDYEYLMEKIVQFKSDVHIIGIPKSVLEVFKNNKSMEDDMKKVDLSDVDPVLISSLMSFQHEGVCYGISKGGRCMIADDMGLGKTIQALGIAHYFRSSWPLLIVVPSSVRYQWSDAIYNFLPSVPTQYIYQFQNTNDFLDDSRIIITSYELLVRAEKTFQKHIFGFIILDESHNLKSIKTARFKAIQNVASQSRHIILLSGTPALSKPIELYSQISLILPRFMSYVDYGIRYCAGEKNTFGWDFNRSSNMHELQLLLKRTCMIRRLKNDVLNQMPTKKREVVMLNPDLIKAGTKQMEMMSKKLERKVLSGAERHNALIQYYNESSIAKQKAICDYVSKLLERKQKTLIFAHHHNILDAICNLAESMEIKYIRIDGRTTPERRKLQVDKFQTSQDCIIAVLSITAANAGITLTAAQLVVFAELFWNPGILCQAEDRVHRIGQDTNVVIQYLIAKQTADDYLWPLIQRKMNVLNEVGLDQDFSLKSAHITKQEDNKQLTLNSFLECSQSPNKIDKQSTVPKDSSATEEQAEPLDLDEELNFCDWDDME